jgi:hypothetical protein
VQIEKANSNLGKPVAAQRCELIYQSIGIAILSLIPICLSMRVPLSYFEKWTNVLSKFAFMALKMISKLQKEMHQLD